MSHITGDELKRSESDHEVNSSESDQEQFDRESSEVDVSVQIKPKMSTLIGSIEAYMPGENFTHYRNRMNHLISGSGIEDSRKLSIAITLMGPTCYSKLVSLLSPEKPEDKSYDEVMTILEKHFKETNNVISDRCTFNMRFRHDGESIEDYIVELKSLSQDCHFGSFLEEALRDRLVSGINDQQIQSKLILQTELTWERAKDICIAEFRARRNIQSMGGSAIPTHAVEHADGSRKKSSTTRQPHGKSRHMDGKKQRDKSKGLTDQSGQQCNRCGLSHKKGECKAANSTCRVCGKRGHWASVCWSSAGTK
ncbi:uncharacterized protein LOC129807997 [Phlebotomus papatasi]|uniref:uncharacterized protein LOC129807997 n=1 Tax=Phlebotomus papatasi TaxID=29031 RepID=UPI0024841368|nr:uncharacterized protein LOC129807997 [Phlebotomus papatasi]